MPIIGWGYILSYMENSPLNTKRFFVWILSWCVSVIPVLYLDDLLKYFNLSEYSIFSVIWWNSESYYIFPSLWIAILISWVILFTGWSILQTINKKWFLPYFRNLLILMLLPLVYFFAYWLTTKIWFLSNSIKDPVSVWNVTYWTIWAILIYYAVVWLTEELGKHLWFISSSLDFPVIRKKWILYCIFVALWFWFVENILYLFNLFIKNWFWSELISVWVFRSAFSVFVHIICSAIVWSYFIAWFVDFEKDLKLIKYAKIILIWFLASIVVHSIYDISLTVWFTWIIFIYMIFWYMYVTKLLYK